jgi:hypothetical protein
VGQMNMLKRFNRGAMSSLIAESARADGTPIDVDCEFIK